MVVQRQNPAYRLAPPTRRLMRRVPGAPGVGPVLNELRNKKGPGWGLFYCCRTARGPNTWGLARLSACWEALVFPNASEGLGAQAGWVWTRKADTARGPNTRGLARLSACWKTLVCPHVKRSWKRRLAGCCAQVRHGARVQRLAPCAAFSLLGGTFLSRRDFRPVAR